MPRISSLVTAMIAFVWTCGCQSPPEQDPYDPEGLTEEEIEQHVKSSPPPPPKDAALGSLGGPCGVNFANCRTGDAFLKKFSSLPKYNFKRIKSACGQTDTRVYGLQVPRLVNDHKGPRDDIFVEVVSYLKSTSPAGPQMMYRFWRNGIEVGMASNNGAQPVIAGRLGGVETIFALHDKKIWGAIGASERASGCATEGKIHGFECTACKIGAVTVLSYLAGVSGGLGVLWGGSAEAGAAVAAAGSAASGTVGLLFACENTCKASECNEEVQRCCQTSSCSNTCYDDFNICCKGSGVVKVGATECQAKTYIF